MSNRHYILDENREAVEVDVLTWARWWQDDADEDGSRRRVGDTQVGEARISTVFLGSDHNWGDGSKPYIFETMVFGGEWDGECERYSTWKEAEAGHWNWVRYIQLNKGVEIDA